jgi:hypothetical protein
MGGVQPLHHFGSPHTRHAVVGDQEIEVVPFLTRRSGHQSADGGFVENWDAGW